MDTDSPWEENPDDGHVPDVEWTKITTEFTNSGYREGIIAGREAFLQHGFDTCFANVGVPLGRELGNLRGTAVAIRLLLNTRSPESSDSEEIRDISSALSTVRFSDIAPRDLEAEQHAKEHLGFVTESANSEPQTVPQGRPTTQDVSQLKERLVLLCRKLSLTDLV